MKEADKTLYNSTEDALNAITDSINSLDKRIDDLTTSLNNHMIWAAANRAAMEIFLKLTSDDILDIYNYAKEKERFIKEALELKA